MKDFKLKNFEIPVNVSRIANVHYFEFVNRYNTKDDSHDFYEIVYVDNGSVEVSSDNYSGLLSSGQMILHSPCEHHSLKCDTDFSANVIIIGFECDSIHLETFSHSPVKLTNNQKRMLAETVNEGMVVYAPPYDIPNMLDMKKREDYPFAADQMLKIRLEMFLISLIRTNQIPSSPQIIEHTDSKLESVHRYIDEHYKEKITLDNICFLFGINKTSLCENFKKEYGKTILTYINQLKIKEAKKLLREERFSVTEISEILGFSSVHYFCRVFKNVTGQSPKTYINTVRSKLNL